MKKKSSISFLQYLVQLACVTGLLFCVSCQRQVKVQGSGTTFEIGGFIPVANLDSLRDPAGKINFYVDYSDALQGLSIPSAIQQPASLKYVFKLRNTGGTAMRYSYKLYYRNESYKFPEMAGNDSSLQHPQAHENFYGSWENAGGFRMTETIPADGNFHEVNGTFRIQGNPRDEQKYFDGKMNRRWRRNPRMGKYSFLLVVVPETEMAAIPEYCRDLSLKKDSTFVEPYYYFLCGDGHAMKQAVVVKSRDTLNAISRLPLGNGVYVDPLDYPGEAFAAHYNSRCGYTEKLSRTAVFKQFIHFVDSSSIFDNIPVVADVAGDAYTLSDYNWNKAFYTADETVRIMPSVADCPCDEVITDTARNSIRLVNKAVEWGQWEKQNIGIITRIGMSYGTYTVKIKMPELLNRYGIWNGLTNAIWLITQSHDPWNTRRTCGDQGYISDYYGDNNKRIPNTSYSEIDFEMIKTGPYCPEYRYAPGPLQPLPDRDRRNWWDLPYPEEGTGSRDQIMVCCTNWDMACPQPDDYAVGCQDLKYADQAYTSHRWDYWYKAVTSKTPASDNELFGREYYYFQIIWKPEEIIWKIGPEKDRLKTVGYMNAGMTSIPDNQMILIISQEFHNTDWWPGSPFEQGHIPFPAKPLTGEVLEVTIE